MTDVKAKLMNKIGFLKWAQLHPDDVELVAHAGYDGKVFLSPDVNSLHLIWTLPDTSEWQHEIADYPDDPGDSVYKFLDEEVLQDAWETEPLTRSIYRILSDYADYNEETMPVIGLDELDRDLPGGGSNKRGYMA
jgi:hypothetical protein